MPFQTGKYKLIALDLDGTLMHQGQVSAENAKWIRAAVDAGACVVLATGRQSREVWPVAETLQLDFPLVVNNGSEVWKSPGELHAKHEISYTWVQKIVELYGCYGDRVGGWAHACDGTYNLSEVKERMESCRWLQIAVRSEDPACLRGIREEVQTWNALEISNSHPTNIEFNAFGINKASGLREVCRLLGITMSEAIAVGDSLNDIAMIREAGLGIAMGNAQEPVKQAARWTTLRNDQDGVAEVIKRWLVESL